MPRANHTLARRARSDLERDALAHPAFAHLSAADVLDHVESGLTRSVGEMPEPERRGRVFSQIYILLGKHCCLCNAVTSPCQMNPPLRTCLSFCKWLCGDFDGSCTMDARTYPLCANCNAKVVIFSANANGTGWGRGCQPTLANDGQFIAVLHSIFGDKCFRARVEANAATFAALRFDPRAGRANQRIAA
jgi:hypothetical protein